MCATDPATPRCGRDNPAGLRMTVYRHGDARYTGWRTAVPCPAAHDDLRGFVLYTVGEITVTRTLTVDCFAPVWLLEPHRLTARMKLRNERQPHLEAHLHRPGWFRPPIWTA